mmetsp:Transcript_98405/g.228202  ORF Transcript_98405/g.228202 Transcript_98405/m.228202 type:complete len:697 (+) Transcript_98405:53-2143(+)|eukprot:CAMPEP_0171102052 /NCGR_PEP_ID=MMETSP0766_2-20121228/56663_1 /TAXON_ID=439317 /ORGANISM="Gambierdiscus australes, Strain CAWD 149" /LENGTH=696 /DNA_ID=CAMNT_0011562243 /DNA_START=41 /DNA_END=2131 /DNA_ORIENTATION=-
MVSSISTLLLVALPQLVWGRSRRLGSTPSFTTSAEYAETVDDFAQVSRVYIPYNDQATGLAFGMGAAEQSAYDHVNKYAYAISEQGYVNVIDWETATQPSVLSELAINLAGEKLTDIEICQSKELMFIGAGASDTVGAGKVYVFPIVKRGSATKPTLLREIATGPLPDMILPNSDCTKVAVACEGEGVYGSNLDDPVGKVQILSSDDFASTSTTQDVELGSYTDDDLIAKGVHLPLPKGALEYWSLHSDKAASLDFDAAIASYSPNMNLEPEYLAWSVDGTKLFVNLQENNAIAVVDVPSDASPSLEDIYGLGLKDHGTVGIDIKKDDDCVMATYAGLKSLRMPDAIAAFEVDGKHYVITANEGDDKSYGDFDEKLKLKDVIDDDGTVDSDMKDMTASTAAVDTATAIHAVEDSLRITVGSTAVNYTTATAPVVEHIVAFGGRGLSIYEYDSGLNMIWDSGSAFEEEQCSAYDWAHNGIQDEEFAPVNGDLYNSASSKLQETIDEMNDPAEDGCEDGGDGQPGACPLGQTVDERSAKDGAAPEAVVVGVACGKLVAVTATEKQSGAFVYDITNPAAPELLFVKHLSPISETKNPAVAYASQELGEIDPESIIFLDASHSPSGNAGVMFAGAWSGSMSWWEFSCGTPSPAPSPTPSPTPLPAPTPSPSSQVDGVFKCAFSAGAAVLVMFAWEMSFEH